MMTIKVPQEAQNKRIDIFLQEILLQKSRSNIKNMIISGDILCNNESVKSGQKLRNGDIITINDIQQKTLDLTPEDINIDIVYEDNDLAVINKPQGLVVHPANGNESGTLVNALLYHLKNLSSINGVIRPGIVHRLDKNTSGLLVVAKNDMSHISLARQIETKTCHRHYLALCVGNFKQDSGIIETNIARSKKDRKQMSVCSNLEGKKAITNYNVIERFGDYTLVEFILQTGRTHQIRVHCKYINHPIVGDDVYGVVGKFKLNGQLLHAYKIEFNQPTTNERLTFSCDLPDYFKNVLLKLKNKKKQLQKLI